MRHYYGPQYQNPRYGSGGVVPRDLAVRLARERDAIAQQLQVATAQLSRLEDEIRALNQKLLPEHEQVMAISQETFEEAQRAWEETHAELIAQRDDALLELEAVLSQQERVADEVLSEDVQGRDAPDLEAIEASHQRELSKWMSVARQWEEDFERLQKRQDREHKDARNNARRQILSSFLELRDSLSMALLYADDDTENPWRQGIEQVLQRFDDIVLKEGLTLVGKKGEHFDPTVHEAIAMIPGGKPGCIAHVERQGYAFEDDSLARTAKVVVYQ